MPPEPPIADRPDDAVGSTGPAVTAGRPVLPSAADGAPARRWLAWWGRVGIVTLVVTTALMLLLAAAAVVLDTFILPRVDQWRGWAEQIGTRAVGHPVRIGAMQRDLAGGRWAIRLSNVRLLDAQQRPALALRDVRVAVTPRGLLQWPPALDRLAVDGARLEVRRDASGRLHVAGIEIDDEKPATDVAEDRGALEDWLARQRQVQLTEGTLRWVDEWRAMPPLQLEHVNLDLRNRGTRHTIALAFTPPAAMGQRTEFAFDGRHAAGERRGDWRRYSGTWTGRVRQAELRALASRLPLPTLLDQGRGDMELAVDLERGVLREVRAVLDWRDVQLRLPAPASTLQLPSVAGRVQIRRDREGVRVHGQQLKVEIVGGQTAPAADVELSWKQRQTWQPVVVDPQVASAAAASAGVVPSGSAASSASVGAQDAASGPSGWIDPAAVLSHAPVTGGQLRVQGLDLALVSALAQRLPTGAELQRTLESLQPRGLAQDFAVRWDGEPDAPTNWSMDGRIASIALAAGPLPPGPPGTLGRPGVQNADLRVWAHPKGGTAQVLVRDGALEFPGLYAQARVPMRTLESTLDWSVGEGAPVAASAVPASAPASVSAPIVVNVRTMRFANDDARGELSGRWRTGPGSGFGVGGRFPGLLDLSGTLAEGRAERVAAYLPLGIPEDARSYVARAVQAGTITKASYRVRGDLWRFPFASAREGEFQIDAQLRGVRYAYIPPELAAGGSGAAASNAVRASSTSAPASASRPNSAAPARRASVEHWPALEAVNGRLIWDRTALAVAADSASLWGLRLRGVTAQVADVTAASPMLLVNGRASGPAEDMLRFVRESPVGGWIEHALEPTRVSGDADLALKLRVPLADTERTQVQGSVTLAGNEVRLRPEVPLLAAARGTVDFSDSTLAVRDVAVQALGGAATVSGGISAQGAGQFTLTGSAEALALERALLEQLDRAVPGDAPALPLDGSMAYTARWGWEGQAQQLTVETDLQGLHSALPAPLDKPRDARWPLRVRMRAPWPPQSASAPTDWEVALSRAGEPAQPAPSLWLQAMASQPVQGPLAARLGLGAAPPAARPGRVRVAVDTPGLEVPAWRASSEVLARRWSIGEATDKSERSPSSGSMSSPVDLELRAGAVRWDGIELRDVQWSGSYSPAHAAAPASVWNGTLRSALASGQIRWESPAGASGAGAVSARLDRVDLAALRSLRQPNAPAPRAASANSSAPVGDRGVGAATAWSPRGWPALNLRIADLRWEGNRSLGPVSLAGAPDAQGWWKLHALRWEPAGAVVVAAAQGLPLPPGLANNTARSVGAGAAGTTGGPAGAASSAELAAIGASIAHDDEGSAPRAAAANAATATAARDRANTAAAAAGSGNRIDLRMEIRDAGAFARLFGESDAIRGAAGTISGTLGWPGDAADFAWERARGHWAVDLGRGQFLQANPGPLGRMLGLLNLQALPRRLLLDFRDVTSQGLAFDAIDGTLRLERGGLLRTDNLRVRGAIATVLLEGHADLPALTQDVHIAVVPQIDAGAASLAYIAIHPVIGVGTFLAQLLLRDPLRAAGTREFRVTGPMSDPVVTPLARKGQPAATPGASGASGASSPSGASEVSGRSSASIGSAVLGAPAGPASVPAGPASAPARAGSTP